MTIYLIIQTNLNMDQTSKSYCITSQLNWYTPDVALALLGSIYLKTRSKHSDCEFQIHRKNSQHNLNHVNFTTFGRSIELTRTPRVSRRGASAWGPGRWRPRLDSRRAAAARASRWRAVSGGPVGLGRSLEVSTSESPNLRTTKNHFDRINLIDLFNI